MVRVRVPAGTANLGPGFDCLSLSLALYNEVIMEWAQAGLEIIVTGPQASGIPSDESNIVYRAAEVIFKRLGVSVSGLKIRLICRIPAARGLGSSAAAIIGGMLAANALCGNPLRRPQILETAGQMETHPDNLAPALFGGFVVAVGSDAAVEYVRLEPPQDLRVAAAVPEFPLSTAQARTVLPAVVPRSEAVFNVGRAALMVAAVAAGRNDLFRTAMDDRLHQPYRAQLVPGLSAVLEAAVGAGALGACLSGAGPTVIGLCRGNAPQIAQAMCAVFEKHGVKADPLVLDVDRFGADIEGETGENDASG